MNQLTLRKIPKSIEDELRNLATQTGESINKTAIALLRKALGLGDDSKKKRDLTHLAGTWSKEDEMEFKKNTEVFNSIDEEIWK